MRIGLRHNPQSESVLFDLHVRHLIGPSKLIPDPMHSYASNGIANQEIMSLWSLLVDKLDSGALVGAIVDMNFRRAHETILSRGIRGLFNEKKLRGDLYKGLSCVGTRIGRSIVVFLCSPTLRGFCWLGTTSCACGPFGFCCALRWMIGSSKSCRQGISWLSMPPTDLRSAGRNTIIGCIWLDVPWFLARPWKPSTVNTKRI